jgi:hypothetical protein
MNLVDVYNILLHGGSDDRGRAVCERTLDG